VFEHYLTIKMGGVDDADTLRDLAALDSRPALKGDVLLAVVGDEPVAAISLVDGKFVADPFRPTASTVELLKVRAAQHAEPVKKTRAFPSFVRRVAGRRIAQTA
jgi:hypothetical protein